MNIIKILKSFFVRKQMNERTNNTFPINNSLSIIEPVTRKVLLSIDATSISQKHYPPQEKLVSSNFGNHLNVLLQQLPIAYSINNLASAFKFSISSDAIGNIMNIKEGFGTAIITNGKISTHGSYIPIDSAITAPLAVFSIMSIITGQYFMSKINKSIIALKEDIQRVINILLDDKESKNQSMFIFYNYVMNNFNTIFFNNDLRLSSLINIQNNNVILIGNILFYEKCILRKIHKIKENKNTEIDIEIFDFINERQNCIQLFVLGKVLEIRLAQLFNDELLLCVKNDLDEIVTRNIELFRLLNEAYENKFNEIYDNAWRKKKKERLNNQYNQTAETINTISNKLSDNINIIKSAITDIQKLYSQENSYLFINNDLYKL